MASTLAKAYVQIVPSAEGIQGSITEALGGEADSAGQSAGKKIVSKITKAIAVAGFGKVLASSLTEGAALEQSIGGIETLFKDSADTMKNYANQAYKTAGVSANDYMEQATSFSASLLQSLGGDTAKAAEYANRAIIDMGDNANKMGTNIEDIQNAYQGFAKDNYTMLDNLKLGYGGTKTEMERLVKDASEMTDIQEKLGVTVDESSLSFANVVDAISVMQESLGITGTTALEAASTLSGSFASMKAAAKNFLGYLALGEDIEPSLNALIDSTCTFLFDNLFPMVGNVIKQLPKAIGTIVDAGMEIATELMDSLSQGISGNISSLIKNAMPIITEFSASLRQNAGKLIDAGLNLIKEIASGLIDGIPSLIQYVPQIVTNIASIINDNAPKILQTGVEIIGDLINGLIKAIPTLVASIPQIIEAVVAVFTAFNWLDIGKNAMTYIKNGITNMKASVGNSAGEIKDKIVSMIKELPTKLKELATNAVTSIKEKFSSIDWKQVGSNVVSKIRTAISELPGKLLTLAQNAVTNIKNKFSSIDWKTVGSNVVTKIGNAIAKLPSSLLTYAKNAVTDFKNKFSSTDWKQVGKDIINGIVNGVTGAAGSLLTAAKNAANSALGAIKKTLGIKSPSKVFRDEVGRNIDLGIAGGIEGNLNEIQDAMDDIEDETMGLVGSDLSYSADIVPAGASSDAGAEILSEMLSVLRTIENSDQDIVIKIDNREFGRAVKKYA